MSQKYSSFVVTRGRVLVLPKVHIEYRCTYLLHSKWAKDSFTYFFVALKIMNDSYIGHCLGPKNRDIV